MGTIVVLAICYVILSIVIIKKSNYFAKKLMAFREKRIGAIDSSEEMLRKYEVSIAIVGYITLTMSGVLLVCVIFFRLIVL